MRIQGAKPGLLNWLLWAFFGNELDGPVGAGTHWNPHGEDTWQRRVRWWLRNPAHNFMWHVVGFAHLPSTRFDERDEDGPGWNKAWSVRDGSPFHYPYWLYIGKQFESYIGWRGRGNFGISFRRKS